MKFKAIIAAAATALIFAFGSFGAAAVKAAADEVDTPSETYPITAVNSESATINVVSSAKAGDTVSVTATVKPGYNFFRFIVSYGKFGKKFIVDNPGSFTMPADNVTVSVQTTSGYRADFISNPTSSATLAIRGVSNNYSEPGKNISVEITPHSGYYYVNAVATNVDTGEVIESTTSNTLSFTMPAARVKVVVTCSTTPPDPTKPTTPTTPTEPTPTPEPTPIPTPTPEPEPVPIQIPNPVNYKGDVNGDGIINTIDATLALKHIVQLTTLNSEQLDRADVNGDGRVNTADATLILKMSVGLIPPSITN